MKLARLLGAICAALLSVAPARATEQATYVMPTTGPMNMATYSTGLNSGLRALASCSWGTSAPVNGPGAAALPYQCWADTTTNPVVLKVWDGTTWVVAAKLNTSSHLWTPVYQGTDLSTASTAATGTSGHTLGFLDGANTWSAFQTAQGSTGTSPGWYVQLSGDSTARIRLGLNSSDIPGLFLGPGSGGRDTFLERFGAASWRFGDVDAAAPVAQIVGVQNVVAGTSNTAGADWTWQASRGTGTGAGGCFILQAAAAGSSGSTQNALANALKVCATGSAVGSLAPQGAGTLNLAALYSNNVLIVDSSGNLTAANGAFSGPLSLSSILVTNSAAPSTPASGKTSVYADSTDKRLHDKNDAGTIGTTVVADTGAANNFLTAISAAGAISKARPACANLSDASVFCSGTSATLLTGTLQAGQFPALTGDVTTSAGSLATAIGATKVTSAMLNADVFSTAHSWGGTQTFTAPVTSGLFNISGALKFSTQSAPAQITSNQNDYNPSSVVCATSATLLINSDAARDVTGLAGGVTGCEMRLVNNGSFTITLKEQNASSTAANRFNSGGDIALAANTALTLLYDGTASRWRMASPGSTGGGGGTVTSVVCGTGLSGGTITTSGTCAVNLSALTNSLGVDVALNNTGSYFDGPSVGQGTSGTWFASGTVTLIDTAGVANILCILRDGTTVFASGQQRVTGASNVVSLSLSGYLASPAGNIRISCRDTTSTSGSMLFNQTGQSKDSTISVFRIQ